MFIKPKPRQKFNDWLYSIVNGFIKSKPAKPLMKSHLVLSMPLLKQIALFSFNTFTLSNKYAFVNLLFKFSAYLTFAVHNDLQWEFHQLDLLSPASYTLFFRNYSAKMTSISAPFGLYPSISAFVKDSFKTAILSCSDLSKLLTKCWK